MDKKSLTQLVQRAYGLVQAYGLEIEHLSLVFFVPSNTFDAIKPAISTRGGADLAIELRQGVAWSLTLVRLGFLPPHEDSESALDCEKRPFPRSARELQEDDLTCLMTRLKALFDAGGLPIETHQTALVVSKTCFSRVKAALPGLLSSPHHVDLRTPDWSLSITQVG